MALTLGCEFVSRHPKKVIVDELVETVPGDLFSFAKCEDQPADVARVMRSALLVNFASSWARQLGAWGHSDRFSRIRPQALSGGQDCGIESCVVALDEPDNKIVLLFIRGPWHSLAGLLRTHRVITPVFQPK